MAVATDVKTVTLTAGEDLRGDQYEILTIENDSDVGKVIKASAVTNTIVGILAENPDSSVSTDGRPVAVTLVAGGGVGLCKAGAAVTAGQLAIADATAGRIAGAASQAALAADAVAIGVILESGADGDVVPVLLQPMTSSLEGA